MNIAVIDLKDLIKYAAYIVLIICIICIGICSFKKEEFEEEFAKHDGYLDNIKNSSFLWFLKTEISIMDIQNSLNSNQKRDYSYKMLENELAIMHKINKAETVDNTETEYIDSLENENIDGISTDEESNIIEEIPESIETQVINLNNIDATYTNTSKLVKINNQTSYNISDILENPSYEIKNKQKIIIYHTHTCESYTSSENYKYEMTGTYRTTDLNYTVSRVGDELEKYLIQYGKTVVHDKTYHDYPAYNGSYGRSLKTMQSILERNSDAEIMIDLHRDAIGNSNTYGPTVKIGEETCAQIMFVIGTDGSGLYHPNWRQNLSLAIKIQQKAEEIYPRTF